MDGLPEQTNIEALSEPFKVINPHAPLNPQGTCEYCAAAAADCLVNGFDPTAVTPQKSLGEYSEEKETKGFSASEDQPSEVLAWLQKQETGAVYAVDSGDHAFNYIIGEAGSVYVFDSNQHVFKQIHTTADFLATGHNATMEESYYENYGRGEDDGNPCELSVIYWGKLNSKWSAILMK